ncbi:4-dihydrotrisporin dehydrogenase [Choanephora cucurbitarum]|nr:4-dihydrotrisporin dehydrogenase [Choanephora cucurbitarum]
MSKTYIVTGASRGLGLEFVKQIIANGNRVFACARNPNNALELAKLVDNQKVFAVKMDADDEASIKAAAEEINAKAPEGIDVLINNAGMLSAMGSTFETCTKDDLLKTLMTNVVGVNEATKAFVPLLRKGSTKKILNMSSILGSIELVDTGNGDSFGVPYGVSKAALNMLTKSTAMTLANEGFIVYASHPGWVQTDMGGKQAPLTTEDSIRGQLSIIDRLSAEDNGKYMDYQGKALPW